MDLHVFIEVFGPPCEAYALMAHAMEEVKKFLVPVCIVMFFFILKGEDGLRFAQCKACGTGKV